MCDALDSLTKQVRGIAAKLNIGFAHKINEDGDRDDATTFLEDCLEVLVLTDLEHEIIGGEFLVAFGGPEIWVDLRRREVRGNWGKHTASAYIFNNDTIGELFEAIEELYCIS